MSLIKNIGIGKPLCCPFGEVPQNGYIKEWAYMLHAKGMMPIQRDLDEFVQKSHQGYSASLRSFNGYTYHNSGSKVIRIVINYTTKDAEQAWKSESSNYIDIIPDQGIINVPYEMVQYKRRLRKLFPILRVTKMGNRSILIW